MTAIVEKTAGMVRGTPEWQLDNQYEAETAAEWERQNAEAEPINLLNRKDYDTLISAWAALENVKAEFGLMETNFAKAMEKIPNTPESDRLASVFDQLSDLMLEVTAIRQRVRKEAHNAWAERRFAG